MFKALLTRLFGERAIGKAEYFLKPGLKGSWGGPMNGQVFRRRIYADLVRSLPLQAIVETGTYRGTTTSLFEESGLPVYTVEASPRFHAYSQLRLRKVRDKVHLFLGDSRSFMKGLATDPSVPKADVLFYLDAHWEEDLPLREEVELIFANWERPVVLVDDFEVPGTDYAFDDYGPGKALTLDYLRPLERLGLSAYFPVAGADQETGARRGCVVLCRDEEVRRVLDKVETLALHADEPAPDTVRH